MSDGSGEVLAGSRLVEITRQIHELLDEAALLSVTSLSDSEVAEVVEGHEHAGRRMEGLGYRYVVEASDRGVWKQQGYRGMGEYLTHHLRVTDPRKRMTRAAAVVSMHAFTGELKDPVCPTLAEAVTEGAVSAGHVHAVLEALDALPGDTDPEIRAWAEKTLADGAREFTPAGIAALGARILAHVDPDGTLTDDADRARRRRVQVNRQDAQLMSKLVGHLDPKTRAMLEVVFAAWGAPGVNNPDDPDSPSGSAEDADAEALAAAVERDSRTPAQRNHDALAALAKAALDGGLLGTSHRGLPPHVIIKIDESALREAAGVGETATGTIVPISDVIELAAKAQQHLAVFADHKAEVLYLGRARLASRAQRLALFAAYGGCSAPACTQPAMQVEIHHAAADYAVGGTTDIDTLAPACPIHNRRVGDAPGQYTTSVVESGSDAGRYSWTLNPQPGAPPNPARVNRYHRIGELFTRQLARSHEPEPHTPGPQPATPPTTVPPTTVPPTTVPPTSAPVTTAPPRRTDITWWSGQIPLDPPAA